MFDSAQSIKVTSETTVNTTPSVLLAKKTATSWMERFHYNSTRAGQLLHEGGHKATKKEYGDQTGYNPNRNGWDVPNPDMDIIVLQCVPIGEGYLMVELIYRKDMATINK